MFIMLISVCQVNTLTHTHTHTQMCIMYVIFFRLVIYWLGGFNAKLDMFEAQYGQMVSLTKFTT